MRRRNFLGLGIAALGGCVGMLPTKNEIAAAEIDFPGCEAALKPFLNNDKRFTLFSEMNHDDPHATLITTKFMPAIVQAGFKHNILEQSIGLKPQFDEAWRGGVNGPESILYDGFHHHAVRELVVEAFKPEHRIRVHPVDIAYGVGGKDQSLMMSLNYREALQGLLSALPKNFRSMSLAERIAALNDKELIFQREGFAGVLNTRSEDRPTVAEILSVTKGEKTHGIYGGAHHLGRCSQATLLPDAQVIQIFPNAGKMHEYYRASADPVQAWLFPQDFSRKPEGALLAREGRVVPIPDDLWAAVQRVSLEAPATKKACPLLPGERSRPSSFDTPLPRL